jgi:hypothetical protein
MHLINKKPRSFAGAYVVDASHGFENGPADQRVESTAHHGDPALEIEGRQFGAKFLDQQLPEIGLDLIMAGLPARCRKRSIVDWLVTG